MRVRDAIAARSQQSPEERQGVDCFRRIRGKNLQSVRNLTKLSLANVCPVCLVDDELWVGADLLKSRSSRDGESIKWMTKPRLV